MYEGICSKLFVTTNSAFRGLKDRYQGHRPNKILDRLDCSVSPAELDTKIPSCALEIFHAHPVLPDEVSTWQRAQKFPRLQQRLNQINTQMNREGLVPFYHGQSRVFEVSRQVMTHIGYSHLETLRPPNALLDRRAVTQDIRQGLRRRDKIFHNIAFDHPASTRSALLSASLNLCYVPYDSPLFFVFGGDLHSFGARGRIRVTHTIDGNLNVLEPEQRVSLASATIDSALKSKNYSSNQIAEFQKKIQPRFKQASQLSTGQILVIGVPYQSLDRVAYHCYPFGWPTGRSLQQVVKDLVRSRVQKEEYQVRLLIDKQSIHEQGITVVNASNQKEAEQFCGPASAPPTPIEAKEEHEADQLLNGIISDCNECLKPIHVVHAAL